MIHALQEQRYEVKYLVPESVALRIRDFVRSYLVLDAFAAPEPNCSYDNHSIYLDSDRLDTFHASVNGDKNRYKLRLRYYDERPNSPVFFEIKRRMNEIILKQRCGVRREAVPLLMRGHMPDGRHVVNATAHEFDSLQRFCHLVSLLGAKPKAHVAYAREAWVSEADNSVRVTMDRFVRSEPQFDAATRIGMVNPVPVFDRQLVLELKFTNRFPNWFRDLVEAFGLMQSGGAKYVGGILLKGEHQYRGHEVGIATDFARASIFAA